MDANSAVGARPRDRLRGDSMVVGIDVGSTTVKAVVVDPVTKEILWSDYQRHQTKQAEFVLGQLERIEAAFPNVPRGRGMIRTFITGSGAGPLATPIGSKFVQEVNAVTLAVEKLHPDVGSVVELGGQDAKIIIFKEAKDESGKPTGKTAIASMNDKCASRRPGPTAGTTIRRTSPSRSSSSCPTTRSTTPRSAPSSTASTRTPRWASTAASTL